MGLNGFTPSEWIFPFIKMVLLRFELARGSNLLDLLLWVLDEPHGSICDQGDLYGGCRGYKWWYLTGLGDGN